jgi:hypothetical protein
MAWVPDSTTKGYLGPEPPPAPQPPYSDEWEDFLHDVIAGITGLDASLVRPRWQPEPPNLPDFDTDWMAFGVTQTDGDFTPYITHVDEGEGYDALQEHEVATILCSFYGPNCSRYASYLRRGIYIDQNRYALRSNAVGLVEVTGFTAAPELIRERWLDRVDISLILRREVRYDYAIRTIVRAQGRILANDQGRRVITNDFDTGFIP